MTWVCRFLLILASTWCQSVWGQVSFPWHRQSVFLLCLPGFHYRLRPTENINRDRLASIMLICLHGDSTKEDYFHSGSQISHFFRLYYTSTDMFTFVFSRLQLFLACFVCKGSIPCTGPLAKCKSGRWGLVYQLPWRKGIRDMKLIVI